MRYSILKSAVLFFALVTLQGLHAQAKVVNQTIPYNISEVSDYVSDIKDLTVKDNIEISFKDSITGQIKKVSVKPDKVDITENAQDIFYDTKYGYVDYFSQNLIMYNDGNKRFTGHLLSPSPAYPSRNFTDGTWVWNSDCILTSFEWEGTAEPGFFKDNKGKSFTWKRKVKLTYKVPVLMHKYEVKYSGSYVFSTTITDEKPKTVTSAPAQAQPSPSQQQSGIQTSLVNYLTNEANAVSVMKRALALHYGVRDNTCVYFLSEALRRVGLPVPVSTANTTQLTKYLTGLGWQKSYDYKQLRAGDICFTTDVNLRNGFPTHTYTFVSWVTPGSYDYANIVDNQNYKYDGSHNHVRNVAKVDLHIGDTKEPFSYFLRK